MIIERQHGVIKQNAGLELRVFALAGCWFASGGTFAWCSVGMIALFSKQERMLLWLIFFMKHRNEGSKRVGGTKGTGYSTRS